MSKLDGLNAVVTGSSKGIGLATAIEMAKQGAKVLCISRTLPSMSSYSSSNSRNSSFNSLKDVSDMKMFNEIEGQSVINNTAQKPGLDIHTSFDNIEDHVEGHVFPEIHPNIEFMQRDVSISDTWDIIAKHIKNFYENRIDILVNNAGIHGFDLGCQNPEDMLESTFDKMIINNLKSVFLGCKMGIKLMKNNPNDSVIINVGSRSGLSGSPYIAAYGASKAGIDNYSKSVALYCADKNYNIRCLCVAPAMIDTDMLDPLVGAKDDPNRDENLKQLAQNIPLKKVGRPVDVANLICFLASDEARYMTGSTVQIDGGILAGTATSPKRRKI